MPFSDSEIVIVNACKILQDLPPDVVREALGKNVEPACHLPCDAFVFEAGEIEPGLYIVAQGTIELFVVDADGKEKAFDFAKAGDTLASETLFNGRSLQYSARSLTPATVLHLPSAILSQWVANHPLFARRLMAVIAERIDFLFKDMLTLRTKKATARLVCYLVCHFDKAPKTPDGSYSLHIDIPRSKLAARLGISDSHLSRTFRELQEKGLIVPEGRGYFIPDVPALSKYVCPAGCAL